MKAIHLCRAVRAMLSLSDGGNTPQKLQDLLETLAALRHRIFLLGIIQGALCRVQNYTESTRAKSCTEQCLQRAELTLVPFLSPYL